MATPPSVVKLQGAIEGAMDELQRKQLVPLQKQAFLCSAACCDKPLDMAALQQCTVNCQQRVQTAHQAIYGGLQDFQARFQRCLVRCDDQARDSLPAEPKDKDIERAQARVAACMDGCADEYAGKVPKLKADIQAKLPKK
ncbi:FAM136A [Scenedesmus sp. PABB004]|nr:FAM136A [Scenedesmus sp. PABB004]